MAVSKGKRDAVMAQICTQDLQHHERLLNLSVLFTISENLTAILVLV